MTQRDRSDGERVRAVKPLGLRAYWSTREKALVYYHYVRASDGGVLSYFFEQIPYLEGRTLAQELEHRGFDLTTLRFQIRRKQEP